MKVHHYNDFISKRKTADYLHYYLANNPQFCPRDSHNYAFLILCITVRVSFCKYIIYIIKLFILSDTFLRYLNYVYAFLKSNY